MTGSHLVGGGGGGAVGPPPRDQRRLLVLQPLRSTTMDDLLPEPHQADEGAQGAGHHEAALETISQEVLPGRRGSRSGLSSGGLTLPL